VIFGVEHIWAAILIIFVSAGAGAVVRRALNRLSANLFLQPFCAAVLAGVIGAVAVRWDLSSSLRLVAVCPCMVLVPGPHFAARYRLPAVYPFRYFAASGGLMSYGTEIEDLFRRSAGYVDRLLKGAKASELPVQNPTKFALVINLKTAKALGVTVPLALLGSADEVIE
jgi:hypothetical protein